MEIKVQYSKEYRNKQFVETGVKIPAMMMIEVDPVQLSPESRKVLLSTKDFTRLAGYGTPDYYVSDAADDVDTLIRAFAKTRDEYIAKRREKENAIMRDRIAKLEQLASQEKLTTRPGGVGIESFADTALQQRAKELFRELEERWSKQYAEAVAVSEEREAAEKARIALEKMEWIRAHGSPYLREACEAGYDCQRRYVTERAKTEYPEYTVDFDDIANWRSRSCPSPAALAEAKRVGEKVVWLTSPAYSLSEDPDDGLLYEPEPWEAREAVVKENYLGKYTLVREF